MNRNLLLTISSLLAILFGTFHLADDVVRGFEPGGLNNLIMGVALTVVWLFGTLVLGGRLSGYIIMLLGGLLASFIPYVHMSGKGVGAAGSVAGSSGQFFFVWTLFALGATGIFSVILSILGLWNLLSGGRRDADAA
jgi:hypothetical protein